MYSSLDELRAKSIGILREAKDQFKNLAILWSGGKDSTAILELCREAFLDHTPFPIIHIDNGIDFPETHTLRDALTKKWGVHVLVARSVIKDDKISGFPVVAPIKPRHSRS